MQSTIYLGRQERKLADFPHLYMVGHRAARKTDLGTLPRHRNPGIEFCYIHKGRFDWTVEGRRICVLPGSATVTLPWQSHGGTHETMDIGEISWLIICPERFEPGGLLRLGAWSSLPRGEQAYIARQLLGSSMSARVLRQPGIGGLFKEIMGEVAGDRVGRVWRVNRLLDELLLMFARAMERSGREPQRHLFDIRRIEDAVRKDPGRRWALADLCALSGWSKSALNPRIQDVTGYSSKEYVMALRIEMARERLRKTNRPITEIGLELGFSSSQHFSVAFRQRVGMSPLAFRNRPTPL